MEKTRKFRISKTRRAMLMSVLSMLLCCSMLVGTTFAWFTDSVTSGKNKIVAGNLDVELYHTSASVEDETKIEGKTDLFLDADGKPILWEPGVIAYENFTVKNVGSLALKYKLALDVAGKNTVTVDGKTHSLDEVIQVAFIEGKFEGDREAAQKLDYKPLADTAKTGVLLPKDETTPDKDTTSFAVVLYWKPTENDNLYNVNNGKKTDEPEPSDRLWIELGVDLTATQYTYENDSFNDQYDKNADDNHGNVIELTSVEKEVSSTELTSSPLTFVFDNTAPLPEGEHESTTVELEAGALAAGSTSEKHTVDLTIETEFESYTAMPDGFSGVAKIALSLLVDGEEVHNFESGKKATITTKIPAGLENVEVKYNGEDGEDPDKTDVKYDSDTGVLTFKTTHFSEFEVICKFPEPTFAQLKSGKELFKTGTGIFNQLLNYKEVDLNISWRDANYSVKKVVFCDFEDLASKYDFTPTWNSGKIISENVENGKEARVFVTSKKDAMYICVESSTDIIYLNENCNGMFSNLGGVTEVDFGEKVSFEKVKDLYNFFNACSSLTTVKFGDVDVSNATDFGCMFGECESLTELDLSGWNTPVNANITKMFTLCSKLKTVYIGEGWKLSKNASDFGSQFNATFQTK